MKDSKLYIGGLGFVMIVCLAGQIYYWNVLPISILFGLLGINTTVQLFILHDRLKNRKI